MTMPSMMPVPVSRFVDRHFQHFNAAALKDAADGFCAHLDAGGHMLLTMAGAMSTAELGLSLAEMIRQGKVHAIVSAFFRSAVASLATFRSVLYRCCAKISGRRTYRYGPTSARSAGASSGSTRQLS